jgi:hypothetical protein
LKSANGPKLASWEKNGVRDNSPDSLDQLSLALFVMNNTMGKTIHATPAVRAWSGTGIAECRQDVQMDNAEACKGQ